MRQRNYKLLPLLALLVLAASTPALGRRVRVSRPQAAASEAAASAEDQEPRSQQVQYYAAQADDAEPERQLVLLPADEAYSNAYGRPALQRQSQEYRPRAQLAPSQKPTLRLKESPKQPPVQTISNYNKVNDDGSFTFGYEAADGSFKEETRGTDCVVRGKYGYVDPDGNKREFTYVSGNPCDPNAKDEEDDDKQIVDDSGEENVPKGPIRPLRPRPALARPTTTVFQNNYVQDEEAVDAVPQQVLYRTTSSPRLVSQRPTPPATIYEPQPQVVTARPTPRPQPAVRITPRPYSASTTVRSQLPATTYRPRHHQAAPTPAPLPGVIYSNSAQPTSSPHSSTSAVDFEETLRQFQLENNVLTTPRSVAHAQQLQARPQLEHLAAGKPTGQALYETQLVYDPASGQYQTVFYQKPPQGSSDISQRHRLQPFAPSQQQHLQPQRQFPQQQQIYQQQVAPPQQVYQQQQAAVVQQSQQLYTQQQQRQRALALQQQPQQQPQQARFTQFQSPAAAQPRYPSQQQYYQQQAQQPSRQFYYAASPAEREGVSHGQIDAFLRSHNIAY